MIVMVGMLAQFSTVLLRFLRREAPVAAAAVDETSTAGRRAAAARRARQRSKLAANRAPTPKRPR